MSRRWGRIAGFLLRAVPLVGTACSHGGNCLFPWWELLVPLVGTANSVGFCDFQVSQAQLVGKLNGVRGSYRFARKLKDNRSGVIMMI